MGHIQKAGTCGEMPLIRNISFKYELLTDYRLTCNIQIIKLEGPDISFGAKTSSEVKPLI